MITTYIAYHQAFGEYKYGTGLTAYDALIEMGQPNVSAEIRLERYETNKPIAVHNGHMVYVPDSPRDEYDGVQEAPTAHQTIGYDSYDEESWDDALEYGVYI